MAGTWLDQFNRGSRKLQRDIQRPVCTVAVFIDPLGGTVARTNMMGVTNGEVEFAAMALLSDVKRSIEAAHSDRNCAWCAERLARVTVAITTLSQGLPGPPEPLGGGLH